MVKEKINILHLRDSPWVDGPGRTILETGVRIDPARYGYYVGAFAKKDEPDHPFISAARLRKLKVMRINESHPLDARVLVRINRIVKREKIDIIHAHEVRSDIIGLIMGKIAGIPVMTTLHGWIENSSKGKLLSGLDKRLLRFFDHIIAVSEKMQRDACRFGVRRDKITVLHNALVFDKYRRNREDTGFRKEIGVNGATLLVGNIGRLSPEKGQDDFLRAAKLVLDKHENARFLLIGVGPEKERLEALSRSLRLNGKALFLGYMGDMSGIYNSLDLVVQSSHTEGMPNVVLEALAMEVPVIATDAGGTREAVLDGQTGTLVRPKRPEEVSEKIIAYINDRQRFMRMAANGKLLVSSKFCINERTRKLEILYDSVYSGRKN